jgi:hypothetical protein
MRSVRPIVGRGSRDRGRVLIRLLGGLLAAAVAACSGSGGDDLANKGGVANTTAAAAAADSTPRTLAAGTTLHATIQDSISSRSSKTGGHVNAIVSLNVTDEGGRVAIPGGSAIVLTITRLAPATGAATVDGVIALDVTSVTVGATTYKPTAGVGAIPHTLQGRAAAPADRDVIVTPGTPITITLTQPLKISAK